MNTAEVLTPIPRLVKDEFDNKDRYEIIDGVRVELPPMSANSSGIANDLVLVLSNHGLASNLGMAYTEMLFHLPLPVDRNRRPDVAFVPFSRWARGLERPDTNEWHVLPDLLVEVISPNDLAEEVESKVEEYLQAGARLVWVVYPRQKRVYVYEPTQSVRRLSRSDTLVGDPVLPGFRLPLIELFPEPPAAQP